MSNWQVVDGQYQTWVDDKIDDEGYVVVPGHWKTERSATTSDLNYAKYNIDPNAKDKAGQLTAQITRQQYDDYQKRFIPYLKKLNAETSSPGLQKAETQQAINNQFSQNIGNAQATTNRNLSRFGMAQTDRERQSGSHLGLINSTQQQTQLTNQMNNAIDERTDALVSGGALSGGR